MTPQDGPAWEQHSAHCEIRTQPPASPSSPGDSGFYLTLNKKLKLPWMCFLPLF